MDEKDFNSVNVNESFFNMPLIIKTYEYVLEISKAFNLQD
jgi:hypothetical protein